MELPVKPNYLAPSRFGGLKMRSGKDIYRTGFLLFHLYRNPALRSVDSED